MPQEKIHDLIDFMQQMSEEISAEYQRIQKRATEDPGTAGDQGEENWADLLRGWLPSVFEVVTKGRIIGRDGLVSPQVDILVLSAAYPKKLLNKKVNLAAGVVAAFECKTTLKASHIAEAMENSTKIKALYPNRLGTPYKELNSPLVYGLLAHSHTWQGEGSTPEKNIERNLYEADLRFISHPRFRPDFLCVADLGTWVSTIVTFLGPRFVEEWSKIERYIGCPNGGAISYYAGHTETVKDQVKHFTPIGALISSLSQRLAWENPSLRSLADYYRLVNIGGLGGGRARSWPTSIYSDEVRARVEMTDGLLGGLDMDEWPWYEWMAMFTW